VDSQYRKALCHGGRLSVIRLQGEKVAEVTRIDVPRVGDSLSSLGPRFDVSLALDPQGPLMCKLWLKPAQAPVLAFTKEVSYGSAFTVPSGEAGGLFVVLFEAP
jgi:hypothetical protein